MGNKIIAWVLTAALLFTGGYVTGRKAGKEDVTVPQTGQTVVTEDGVTLDYGVPFENIMGYDGYYDQEKSPVGFSMRRYYGKTDDGRYLCIGQSFRIGEIEDYVVDIDGDGITELVCNTVTGASTHSELYVYKWTKDGILKGHVGWSEEDLPGLVYWGSNAVQTRYEPYANDARVLYSIGEDDVSIVKSFNLGILSYKNVGFVLLDESDAHGTYRDELE